MFFLIFVYIIATITLGYLCFNHQTQRLDISKWSSKFVTIQHFVQVGTNGQIFGPMISLQLKLPGQALRNYIRTHLSHEIEETIMSLAQELRAEGRREGRQEGLQKGLTLGEHAMLKKLLVRRFGDLPFDLEVKLNSASSEQLLLLGDHLFETKTIDELFEILDGRAYA